jgi:threonine dehydratase
MRRVDPAIRPDDIRAARSRLAGRIRRTPLVPSAALSAMAGAPVHLKLEHHQMTGSFKLRGATNAVLSLDAASRARGVVGVSTGNHGRGLAQAASDAGVRCIICLSRLVPHNKVAAIESLGAEVRIVGDSQDDAQDEVDRIVREDGMRMIPPFDDAAIIAGQGTIGLEIVEDLPAVDTIVAPLSGGGLISGIAIATKSANPSIRLVGVSMGRGAAMIESLRAGRPVLVAEEPSLADSLGGGIGLSNRFTFDILRRLVDETVTLTEPEIAAGIRHAYFSEQEIVEGGGSVGIGALLAGKLQLTGPTVLLLSGRNIDMQLHRRIIGGDDVDMATEASH